MSVTADRALEFPLLTAPDVAGMLGGIPVSTVLAYARDGRLPSLLLGRHRRFNRPDIEAAILRAAEEGRPI